MKERIYFESYTIASLEEAMNLLTPYGKYPHLDNDNFVFRGQKDVAYSLIPSALRKENNDRLLALSGDKSLCTRPEWENRQIIAEYDVLRIFFGKADRSGLDLPQVNILRNSIDDSLELSPWLNVAEWLPDDLIEIAGLAQHYGLPTRLLDWTYDYRVALYFAASGLYSCEKNEKKNDCVVWAINHQFFNSTKATYYKSPLCFCRPSYYGNKYLDAQKGLFSMWKIERRSREASPIVGDDQFHEDINRKPLDELICEFIDAIDIVEKNKDWFLSNKLLYKFVIPCQIKYEILKQLRRDMHSEEYLFPGFQGVCGSMENDSKLQGFLPASD